MTGVGVVTASEVLIEGNTAVITGASSGIGRATAIECATRGMHVWMVDIDKEELEAALELVQSKRKSLASPETQQQNIQARVVNVADRTAMQTLANEVFSNNGGKCHFLFNNAGITGTSGSPLTTSMDTIHSTMGVNTYGPIHGCLVFGPTMQTMNEPALIVNTGSKQGITMPPGNTTYNMSKAALKCYTEALEHELRTSDVTMKRNGGIEDDDGTTTTKKTYPLIRAALLIPGWVNTSIMLKTIRDETLAKGEVFDPQTVFFHEDKPASGAWMPNQIVQFMISELDHGKFYIICPDNDVDRETDNLRMTWTMGDIIHDRPPLSRWHEDYKDKFTMFVEEQKQKQQYKNVSQKPQLEP